LIDTAGLTSPALPIGGGGREGEWTGSWYALLALVLVYLPLLFPDGRLPSRRWLSVAVLMGVGTLGVVVLAALADILPVNEASGYEIDNPIGIEGLGYCNSQQPLTAHS
jgi:hypothetical protein